MNLSEITDKLDVRDKDVCYTTGSEHEHEVLFLIKRSLEISKKALTYGSISLEDKPFFTISDCDVFILYIIINKSTTKIRIEFGIYRNFGFSKKYEILQICRSLSQTIFKLKQKQMMNVAVLLDAHRSKIFSRKSGSRWQHWDKRRYSESPGRQEAVSSSSSAIPAKYSENTLDRHSAALR